MGYQSPTGVAAFGRAIGEQPTFAMDFLDGDSWSALVNNAPSYMAAWKSSGLTMIWGVPMLPYNSSSSGDTLQQGATGAYNSYFLKLAQDMVAGGEADSIIRIGWEFNGGWFPWAANGQASAFIGYWQQIVNTMRSVPGQQFTFEWNPTLGDSGVGNLAEYYPGSAYVDYIGPDVYDQEWGYYGAPGCSGTTCQQDAFTTMLTESGGLNWFASFAGQEGKPIVLPEWGLGAIDPTDLNGTYVNEELGGGDDPTFINDMIGWMTAHDVHEASYWDFQQDAIGSVPLSAAAFLADLSGAVATLSGSSATPSSGSSATATGAATTGGVTSSSGDASAPSLQSVFPTSSQTDSAVTIESPTTPVVTSRAAHFAAIVSTVAAGAASPAGSVDWSVTSKSGVPVPCHSGSTVVRRGRRDDQVQYRLGGPGGHRRALHGLRVVSGDIEHRSLLGFGEPADRQGELEDEDPDRACDRFRCPRDGLGHRAGSTRCGGDADRDGHVLVHGCRRPVALLQRGRHGDARGRRRDLHHRRGGVRWLALRRHGVGHLQRRRHLQRQYVAVAQHQRPLTALKPCGALRSVQELLLVL